MIFLKVQKKYFLVKLVILLFLPISIFSQKQIKISGKTVEKDSSIVPYVNIIILNRYKGTISDKTGEFSFLCNVKDTLVFSRVGMKSKYYIIPEVDANEIKKIVIMEKDTIFLKEVTVFPWKSYEEFKYAVLTTNPPETIKERAQKNINLLSLQIWYEDEILDISNSTVAYKTYFYREFVEPMYYRGQFLPNPLTNIFNWYKLIKAINDGSFKKTKFRKEKIEWEEFLGNNIEK